MVPDPAFWSLGPEIGGIILPSLAILGISPRGISNGTNPKLVDRDRGHTNTYRKFLRFTGKLVSRQNIANPRFGELLLQQGNPAAQVGSCLLCKP